jgi:hypothetical protein
MRPNLDARTGEMARAAPGPGRYEWGTLSFERKPYPSGMARSPVDVEIDDEDGSVAVAWNERADDYWGTNERRVHFTAEEFDQIIASRRAARGWASP